MTSIVYFFHWVVVDIPSILLILSKLYRVKMAINLSNNQRVAIKIMKNSLKSSDNLIIGFLKQVSILVSAQHKKIVQIKDFKINGVYKKQNGKIKRILYYTMGLAENGQIFKLIQQTEVFSQKLARYYFQQIIQGLEYLHKNNIAHRDIKTQNLLIDKNYQLKIADFGFSCLYLDHQSNRIPMSSSDTVGSPQLNAPQITNTNQYQQYFGDDADIFASGCVLFYMVMKHSPFKTSNFKDEYYKKFINEDKSDYWKIFSSTIKPSKQFKDLIEKLLHQDPIKRIKLQQIKKHIWYRSQLPTQTQFTKQMQIRFKKIGNMLKNERELEIKNKILKYKKKDFTQFSKDLFIYQIPHQYIQIVEKIQKQINQVENNDSIINKNNNNQYRRQTESISSLL